MNQQALFKISYGLFVLTTRDGERDTGCIINTAMQVTSNPNQICLTVNKANYTEELVAKNGTFNLSILSEAASYDLFKRFGFQSGREVDKFAGFEGQFARSKNGVAYVTEDANAYLSGKVVQTLDIGTHILFVAELTDMAVLDAKTPSVTYTYYQDHIKPKPGAAAAKKGGRTVWRCTVCGYIYEGEELPEDFVCPICKHGASYFEKVEA
ncbi:MAG: flavin reductase [Succiniclasticum sp.]